jgi:hypothetical protein
MSITALEGIVDPPSNRSAFADELLTYGTNRFKGYCAAQSRSSPAARGKLCLRLDSAIGGIAGCKNIVVYSDGTGQDGGVRPWQRTSNVYKLYHASQTSRTIQSIRMNRSPFMTRARNRYWRDRRYCAVAKRTLGRVTGRECHRRHGQLSELRRRRHLAWLRLGPLRNEVNGADSRSGEIGRNAPAAIDSMRIGPSDGTTGLLNFHIENLGI